MDAHAVLAWIDLVVREQPLQPPRLHVAFDQPVRQQRNAGPAQRGIAQHVAAVGRKPAVDFHAQFLARAQEGPALGPGLVLVGIAQALVQAQVGGLRRPAVATQILRTCNHIAVMPGKRAHDQLGLVVRHAYAHRDIDAFPGQIDIGIGQHQLQRDARMRMQKMRDMRPQAQPAERDRHRYAQRTHGLGAAVRDAAVGFIEIRQQPRDLLQIGRARIGQCDLARGAREQRHAQ